MSREVCKPAHQTLLLFPCCFSIMSGIFKYFVCDWCWVAETILHLSSTSLPSVNSPWLFPRQCSLQTSHLRALIHRKADVGMHCVSLHGTKSTSVVFSCNRLIQPCHISIPPSHSHTQPLGTGRLYRGAGMMGQGGVSGWEGNLSTRWMATLHP